MRSVDVFSEQRKILTFKCKISEKGHLMTIFSPSFQFNTKLGLAIKGTSLNFTLTGVKFHINFHFTNIVTLFIYVKNGDIILMKKPFLSNLGFIFFHQK
jgi:hypothetical protein